MRSVSVLLVLAASLLGCVRAVPLEDFYPFGAESGDQSLSRSDDSSSPPIQFADPFVFFGRSWDTAFVGTNGVISFGTEVSLSSPQTLPLLGDFVLVAPFWSDVDTRTGGTVFYQLTENATLLDLVAEEVQSAFADLPGFSPSVLLIATWDGVSAYISEDGLTNTYQCILATDGIRSFAMFLYADDGIQWVVGGSDNQGVLVGFNAGDGTRSFTLPTSFTPHARNITSSSNVGRPGAWVFRTDGNNIQMPGVIIGVGGEEMVLGVGEGEGGVEVCPFVLGELQRDTTVSLHTQEASATAGRDYNETSGELVFTPSTPPGSLCLRIPVREDSVLEANERVLVLLTSTDERVTLLPQATSVTIEDNDEVSVSFQRPAYSVTEGGRARVCVVIEGNSPLPEREVQVTALTRPGTATSVDYVASPIELTIPASGTVGCGRIATRDDRILERPESFSLVLSSSDSAVLVSSSSTTVTILDEDDGEVMIGFDQTVYSVEEGSGAVSVCAVLTGTIDVPVSLMLTTRSPIFEDQLPAMDGQDYNHTVQELIFAPRDADDPHCVSIAILDDNVFEERESIFVELASLSHAVIVAPSATTVHIVDDDVVTVSLEQPEHTVNENAGRIEILCAVLQGEIETEITVTVANLPRIGTAQSGNNRDFIFTSQDLTFFPGQQRRVCGSVFILNDFALEDVEFFSVMLRSDIRNVVVNQSTATVTILDDDILFPEFIEGQSITRIEGIGRSIVCMRLEGFLETNAILSVESRNGTARRGLDFNLESEILTFHKQSGTSHSACVRLQFIEDEVFEHNEVFSLLVRPVSRGIKFKDEQDHILVSTTLHITITDNDDLNVIMEQEEISVSESVGMVRMCAVMEGRSEREVVIMASTRDGTAIAGIEYEPSTMDLVFGSPSPNTLVQGSVCMDVVIFDDEVVEELGVKTFSVELSSRMGSGVFIGTVSSTTVRILDDDNVTVALQETRFSVGEDVGGVSVCVGLTGMANFPILVHLRPLDFTATGGTGDFNSSLLEVVLGPSEEESECLHVAISDDSILETTETFAIRMTVITLHPRLHTDDGRRFATVTILDNDGVTVSLDEARYSVDEGEGSITACTELVGQTERNVTIMFTTVQETAEAGVDYTERREAILFEPSTSQHRSQCTSIAVLEDEILEDTETFVVALSTTDPDVTITRERSPVSILDNDSVRVSLGRPAYSVGEGEGSVTACVNVTGRFVNPVEVMVHSVALTAEASADYQNISTSLLFVSSEEEEQRRCVEITIHDDSILEDDETFSLSLSSTEPAVRYNIRTAVVSVVDDDRVTVGLEEEVYVVGEGEGEVRICSRLVGVLERDVSVTVHTTAGSALGGADYEEVSVELVFHPGEQSHCVDVPIANDTILEITETFSVVLLTSDPAVDLSISAAMLEIRDDDFVVVGLTQTEFSVSEGGPGSLTVTTELLRGSLERSVEVVLQTSPLTAQANIDYEETSATFIFGTADVDPSVRTRNMSISIFDDSILEDSESFLLQLTTSDPGVMLTSALGHVTIVNDDSVTVSVVQEEYTVDESDGHVTVCLELEGESEREVVIGASTRNETALAGIEYEPSTMDLVFGSPSPNTLVQGSVCMDVVIFDDEVVEELGVKTFSVELSSRTEEDGVFIGTVSSTTVRILDDDNVTVALQETRFSVGEDVGGVSVCVGLTGVANFPILVHLRPLDFTATGGTGDFNSSLLEVVLGPSEEESECLHVAISDDSILETTETFAIRMTVITLHPRLHTDDGRRFATVTILDNDGVTVSLDEARYSVDEGEGSITACTELVGQTERNVTIMFTTVQETAEAGVDYTERREAILFEPSTSQQRSQCTSIAVLEDEILEDTETFVVALRTIDPDVTITRDRSPVSILDNDSVRVSLGRPAYSVGEGEGSMTACVNVTGRFVNPVEVMVHSVALTAEASADYQNISTSLLFVSSEEEEQRRCVEITIHDDSILEDDETFSLSLSSTEPAVRYNIRTAVVSVVDDDRVTVGLEEEVYVVGEGEGEVRICSRLVGILERDVSVTVHTTAGSALGGADYEEVSVELVFHPGEQSHCVDVPITNDTILEITETFSVVLLTSDPAVDLSISAAMLEIRDDDFVVVGLTQTEFSVSEGGPGSLTVTTELLRGSLERRVEVVLQTSPLTAQANIDYEETSATFIFGTADVDPSVRTRNMSISIFDDSILEDSETFLLQLTTSDPGVMLTSALGHVTIVNDDSVTVSVVQEEYTVDESDGHVTVCLELEGESEREVVIGASTRNETALAGIEYEPSTMDLVFGSPSPNTLVQGSVCMEVVIFDDEVVEELGVKTFSVELSSRMEEDGVFIGTVSSTTVRILDDDNVTVALQETRFSVGEDVGGVSVCVGLTGMANFPILVHLRPLDFTATGGTGDFNSSLLEVVLGPSEEESECLHVAISDDSILETTETFAIRMTVITLHPRLHTDDGRRFATVTILDNDGVTVSLDEARYSVDEGEGSITACTELVGQTERNVTIMFTTVQETAEAGVDYTERRETILFEPSTSQHRSQCTSIAVLEDEILEDTETFVVALSTTDSDVTITRDRSPVSILDNDSVRVSLGRPAYSVGEGEGSMTACVNVTGRFVNPVEVMVHTVALTAEASADYQNISTSLLFESSEEEEQRRCVEITIHDDSILEDDETFSLSLSSTEPAVRYNIRTAVVSVVDDDRVTVGLEEEVYVVGEGEGEVRICSRLVGVLERDVSVTVHTTAGSALGGADFEVVSVELVFHPGEQSHCVDVPITNDTILEITETFSVVLLTSDPAVDLNISAAMLEIRDDDFVVVGLTRTEFSVSEGGPGSLTVTTELLRGSLERRVEVVLQTSPLTAQANIDYEETSATFIFGTADVDPSVRTRNMSISIFDDSILEDSESFLLQLTTSDPGVMLTSALGHVTIVNDDSVTVSVVQEEYTVDESDGHVTVCLELEGESEKRVLVNLSVEADTAEAVTDFKFESRQVTFDPNSAHTPNVQCVTVNIVDNLVPEDNETFYVVMTTTDSGVILENSTVVVTILDTDVVCEQETTSSPRGEYDWPETPPNRVIEEVCKIRPIREGGIARRVCGEGGVWERPRVQECYGPLDELFAVIAVGGVTKENMEELALAVEQSVAERKQSLEQLQIVLQLFQEFVGLIEDDAITTDVEIFTSVLSVVDTVHQWPEDQLKQLSSRIVCAFEGIGSSLADNKDEKDITLLQEDRITFRAESQPTEMLKLDGTGVSYTAVNGLLNITDDDFNATELVENEIAHVSLPPSLFEEPEAKGNESVLVFSVYSSAALFPVANASRRHLTIISPIVAATLVGATIVDLKDPVVIVFRLFNQSYPDPVCVSWDFDAAGQHGNWTPRGCKLESSEGGIVMCSCDHLTNFAILVDASARQEGVMDTGDKVSLDIVSVAGVLVALVALILTILALLIFGKLRRHDSTKFRFQLFFAMICLLTVFLLGIDRTGTRIICITASALMHYFTLVAVLWMGASALLVFQKLVVESARVSVKYIVMVSLICWLLPLPAVIAPIAIDRDFGISDDYCFTSEPIVFLAAFLAPVGVVLLFNLVIFLMVVVVIVRYSSRQHRGSNQASKRKGAFRSLLSIFVVMILFGLSWASGAYTVLESPLITSMQYLLAGFTSLLGLFIFFVFCVFAKDMRRLWASVLGCRKAKVSSRSSSGDTRMSGKSNATECTPGMEEKGMELAILESLRITSTGEDEKPSNHFGMVLVDRDELAATPPSQSSPACSSQHGSRQLSDSQPSPAHSSRHGSRQLSDSQPSPAHSSQHGSRQLSDGQSSPAHSSQHGSRQLSDGQSSPTHSQHGSRQPSDGQPSPALSSQHGSTQLSNCQPSPTHSRHGSTQLSDGQPSPTLSSRHGSTQLSDGQPSPTHSRHGSTQLSDGQPSPTLSSRHGSRQLSDSSSASTPEAKRVARGSDQDTAETSQGKPRSSKEQTSSAGQSKISSEDASSS